ncbi:MAG: hypothetical protein NTX54_09770 [Chloroflexi bacterium]|nr:hypothetical protein [Chloroflexota bacterium]
MVIARPIEGSEPGSVRLTYAIGNPGARDHVWVVADGDGQAGARITWAVIEALVGTRQSRYRQLLLGRARISVILPEDATTRTMAVRSVNILDAVPASSELAVLRTFDNAPPTVVFHAQDWGDPAESTHVAAPSGARLIESFTINADLHRHLAEGTLRRRTFLGQLTAPARALAHHPDARIGAAAADAVTRSGYTLRDRPVGHRHQETSGTVRLATGRYVPTLVWRRLGNSSLAECALARYGAHGITIQTFDGTITGRVGTALSALEGALLARLGLSTEDR